MSLRELSNRLKNWRAERPDEWIMDEFIRLAQALEYKSERDDEELEALRARVAELEAAQTVAVPDGWQLVFAPFDSDGNRKCPFCGCITNANAMACCRRAADECVKRITAHATPAAEVAVPDVQVTTTVDAIDAGDHEFIDVLAARVGMRGKVEHKRFEQSDGGVIVLWDGPNLGAVALTVRDDFNRTKCMTVNLLSAPATPAKVEDEYVLVPKEPTGNIINEMARNHWKSRGIQLCDEDYRGMYSVMLSAAQAQKKEGS